jgi:hypothetical protein
MTFSDPTDAYLMKISQNYLDRGEFRRIASLTAVDRHLKPPSYAAGGVIDGMSLDFRS